MPLSPAMEAAIRVFKRVVGLSTNVGDPAAVAAAGASYCSLRFLVPSSQSMNLIGKQGYTIKSIQEVTGTTIRVLPEGKVLLFSYTISYMFIVHQICFFFYLLQNYYKNTNIVNPPRLVSLFPIAYCSKPKS